MPMAAKKNAITREQALLDERADRVRRLLDDERKRLHAKKYVAAYERVPERSEQIAAARRTSARSLARLAWDEDE